MFENNADFDFDDNLHINVVSKAAPTESPSPPIAKRPRTSECVVKLPQNVVKRKFPGPAGLLPDRKDFHYSISEPPTTRNDEVPCSQMSLSVFQSGPWLVMSRDYEALLASFNIKWIKTRASVNKLPNKKAPFLAAIIQSIDCFNEKNPTVNVVLKDTSGEIQGTIIHALYEEYSNSLVVGAVIVLKQFGVLTTGSNNNHHLTITQNNLVTIYVKKNGENIDSDVRIVKVQDVTCQDLVKNLQPPKQNNKVPQSDNSNIFDDEFTVPDDFEECLMTENRKETKKFNFKKKNVTLSCSQISISTNEEHSEIWQNALEGVDADSFFEDF